MCIRDSAYAAQHKDELDAFNKAVRTLMKLNGSTAVDFSALDAEFSALQSGSAELRTQLETLQPDVSALKNIRKYIDLSLIHIFDTFCPNGCGNTEPILLTLDEYEVIRLVDLEQQTHEQCAAQMDISRSTVQEIYESARSKIAACLAHGKPLHITGGNYRICGGQEASHCSRCCRMQ